MFIMQGSTPTHTFNIPYPKNIIDKVIVTYTQEDKIVFERKDNDVIVKDYSIQVELTQENTLALDPSKMVCIQLKIKTVTGKVIPSNKLYKSVEEVLNKEVM